MNLQPVSAVSRNPLMGLRPEDMQRVAIGVSIASIAPKAEGMLTCSVNGVPLSRLTVEQREHVAAIEAAGGDATEVMRTYAQRALNWERTLTQPQDVIHWEDQPGREIVRTLLVVAILASLLIPGGQLFTPYLVAANVAYNLLVPPRQAGQTPQDQQTAGSIFSTSLAGNAARLDQPIWKNCGRVKITPPFAAQPYVEFLPSDPANPTVDCDQYYNVIFAEGIGNDDMENVFIGKTPVSHFQDIIVAQYLAPGVRPSRALPNVVTSDEVSAGFDLEELKYVGGFAACRPGDTVVSIGVDVAAGQGLGTGAGPLTVTWRVEAREIDQFGRPAGAWEVVASESRTASTNTLQRWTNQYILSTPIRCEVRVVRTNAKNADANARDGIQWIGLRAYLSRTATLNASTGYYEVVMRASQQLSNISQRDFSLIVRAKCRTWSPGGGWGPEVFTRNPAWWLAELWTSPVWGLGLADDRVDLQGLYDWSLVCDARQDHFDYSFTSAMDANAAAQLIAHAGRARAFRRAGAVFSVVRDELVDVPVMALTPRNTQPKSMVLHASLPKREQPNGIIVEYQSNVTWDTATIECPCPGFSVTDPADPRYDVLLPPMDKPIYIGLDGITGAKHAEREGLYQAASMALRTTTVSAQTEMEGVIASFMDPIRWMPQIVGFGQCGDVTFWDEPTLVMGLSEPPNWSAGSLFLTLQRDDGSLTTPVLVIPGPLANDVRLPAVPDFELVLDDGLRERPKFILGPEDGTDELVKVSSITDGGKTQEGAQLFNIEAVIDDDRVHLADVHLLPGPGEIQDPIDSGSDVIDDGTGSGTLALARLTDHNFTAIDSVHALTSTNTVLVTLDAMGGMSWLYRDDDGVTILESGSFSHEWLATPAEPAAIAGFEVMAHADFTSGAFALIGPFDAWLDFSADRTWGVDGVAAGVLSVNYIVISIRRVGETTVQASSVVRIELGDFAIHGGGDAGGGGD